MTARTVPTPPSFAPGEELTSTKLNQYLTWMQFWSNKPSFRMYQSVAQSIPNNTYTQVTCDTPDHDSDSGRAAGTPWSYTIPVGMTGLWRLWGTVGFATNATGTRFGVFFRNGVIIGTTQIPMPGNSAATVEINIGDTVSLAAGDVIALYAFQSSGGALNTDAGKCLFGGELASLASP